MIDVIFIAYQFPPLNVAGSFRPLKFVKYLKHFRINPVVFTLSQDCYHKVYKDPNVDGSLLKEIDRNEIEIIQVPSDNVLEVYSNKFKYIKHRCFSVYFGDHHEKWEKYLLKSIHDATKKYNFKVLFVTVPPFSMIAPALKVSQLYNLPLIMDMRDAWSMWNASSYPSIIHYWATIFLERKLFKRAAYLIGTTEQAIKGWKKLHPNIHSDKFIYIPNGYDSSEEALKLPQFESVPFNDKFTITYIGNFYYFPESRKAIFKPWHQRKGRRLLQFVPRKEDWLYRSPYFFFKTIRKLIDLKPEMEQKLILKFAGDKPHWFDNMVREFGLCSMVRHLGFIFHEEAIKLQQESDALLLTSLKVIGGEDYFIAGKTFEYIMANKPILGFVCEGAQKEFLKNSGIAIICDPDKTKESAEKLLNLFENKQTFTSNNIFLKNFHFKKLTYQLANTIKLSVGS